MTIRITCEQCRAVLKVRDELAGSKAKCPKCKAAIVIPELQDAEQSGSDAAVDPAAEAQQTLDSMVDIPFEVTPPASFYSQEEFDPTEGQSAGSGSDGGVATAPKPTVAELMRQHEAEMAKKKGRTRSEKPVAKDAPTAAAATVMTIGTAADALSRTYDQKRGKASEAPRLSREELRAQEEKEAMQSFVIRAGGGLAVLLICGYFFSLWWFAKPLPDLGYVSGVVTQNDAPLGGVEVRFAPMKPEGGLELEIATPSSGFTKSDGSYTLMFDPENQGAIPARHRVSIIMSSGVSFVLPEEDSIREVKVGEKHVFDFKL